MQLPYILSKICLLDRKIQTKQDVYTLKPALLEEL